MWPFTKHYSILDSGVLGGATDWHCHILPGVDDGIRTMESSLEVLAFYEQTGIREVWLTPHIMEDVPNETAALRQRYAELRAAYEAARDPQAGSPIHLHLAAENMIDTLFDHRFEAGDLLTIGGPEDIPGPDGEILLVETSYFSPPMAFEDTLDEIRQKGFHPLLAHPERYVYMGRRDYARLKDSGVRFQLNLMSLVGMYGKTAADKASDLLLDGLYDCFGSDLHRLSPWQRAISDPVLTKKETAALQALRERMDGER
ncbi:MAG: capsular biosynthesis protein [Bacteroidales bacterium]|nr:capsular biosynthesis protein [Bacteroidales bacterium]